MESATMQANDSERDNKNVKQNFFAAVYFLLFTLLSLEVKVNFAAMS